MEIVTMKVLESCFCTRIDIFVGKVLSKIRGKSARNFLSYDFYNANLIILANLIVKLGSQIPWILFGHRGLIMLRLGLDC